MKTWENSTVTPEDIAATFTNGFTADRVQIDEQDSDAVIFTVYGHSSVRTYIESKHNDYRLRVKTDMTLERAYGVYWSKNIFN